MKKPSSTYTGNTNPNPSNAFTVTLKAKWTSKCASAASCENITLAKNGVKNFAYTGNSQGVVLMNAGYYKFEVWGAQGGDAAFNGTVITGNNYNSYGAYSAGTVYVDAYKDIYFYVGGRGTNGSVGKSVAGGWNGGGNGSWDGSDDDSGGGGGGATDVRTVSGTYSNINSLRSRIIVAAGGGGAGHMDTGTAGYMEPGTHGGGLSSTATAAGSKATQTSGYQFGIGQSAVVSNNRDGGGGGGGWYGGQTAWYSADDGYRYGGAGGSSYISGHAGSIAVTSSSSTSAKCTSGSTSVSCSQSWTGYTFTNTLMIDGYGYKWTTSRQGLQQMPNPSGGYYSSGVGRSGNGAARITYLGTSI
ncbi:hypothetical protein IJ798_02245 [Candidatus Saccharibacteria bacterium]|nr:hypothetical protein [Candidatus Saccharibacteria bacterium]